MAQAARNDTTRRAVFAGTVTAAVAIPTVLAARPGTDAQFLEWERQADFWRAASPLSDEECDAMSDRLMHFEELIATTPAAGLAGARVKARQLLHCRATDSVNEERYWCDRVEMNTIRSLIDFLGRGAT